MRQYQADKEFARLLSNAAKTGDSIRIQAGSESFVVQVVESQSESSDIWANYDAGTVREAWRESAGTLQEIDLEDVLQELRCSRDQDTPGRPAWWRT